MSLEKELDPKTTNDGKKLEKELAQKTIEDRKKDELIAEIIQGKDFTAIIKLENYEFHVHLLSIDEQLKVIIDSKGIRREYGDENDASLIILTDTIATLNRAIDKMYKIENTIKEEVKQKFWDYFKTSRDPKVFSNIITPLNQKYTEFINTTILEPEIKNA